MTRQTFKTQDVLRLEVEATPTGTVNLAQNPSGDLGGWAWLTPIAGSLMRGQVQSGVPYLNYVPASGGIAQYFTTEALTVAASQYVSVRWRQAGALYVRARVEWLNSAGAVISSSAQSGYTTGSGSFTAPPVFTYGAVQAPAGTVKARLRFDVYQNTSGGNPVPGGFVYLNEVTVIKAATGTPFVGRTNLATNPSLEVAATGWSAAFACTVARSTAAAFSGAASLAQTSNSATSPMQALTNVVLNSGADAGGRTFTFSVYVRGATVGLYSALALIFKNSGGASLSGSGLTFTGATSTTGSWTRIEATSTAPAGAVSCDVYVNTFQSTTGQVQYVDALLVEEASSSGTYFDGSSAAFGGIVYAWTGTAHASTSTATSGSSDFGYLPPATYVNVIGPTHSINVKRDELNVGTLSAEILDASLDPSQFNLVRPGKRVRLMALNSSTATWEPLFTGKALKGTTAYDARKRPTDPKRARIVLTATDAASTLAQITRKASVSTIALLPYLLEGCGVPWNVNGSGNQVGTATTLASSDNASALDQVAITRDSALGYAWVDRRGVLNAWDRAQISTTVAATLSESVYSDVSIDYDTDRCINVVNVKLRRVNAATGQTVEIPYGPYVDQASIDQWNAHEATFTVVGITDSDAAAAAYAAPILAANATPAVRVNAVSIPIRDAVDVVSSRALLDLFDLVTVSNTNAGISQNMRVTDLEHQIEDGKWMLHLGFTVTGSASSPQAAPPIGATVGVAAGTDFTRGTLAFQYIGQVLGNATNTNLATFTAPIPSGSRLVHLDLDVSAQCGGNQQVTWLVQASTDNVNWTTIAGTGRHTNGGSVLDVGASIGGFLPVPKGAATLYYRATCSVAGGGFNITIGALNFQYTFLE